MTSPGAVAFVLALALAGFAPATAAALVRVSSTSGD
jgi:hypothetical protein